MPELRRDPVIGRWVIISSSRGKRPGQFEVQQDFPQGGTCPFCPGSEDKTPPEILAYYNSGREKNKAGWWVRVIPNKFPALEIEGELNRTPEGMFDRMNGLGAHEVIIETPQHDQAVHDMEQSKLEDVFWAYRDRILDLSKDPRLEYILIFKNHGASAGASLRHPHSQLIAIPMVPIRVKQESAASKDYFEYKERCVYCDIVRQEVAQGTRVVAQNKDFVAFAPFASRYPFELWIVPLRHSSDFQDIQKHEVASLAAMMKLALGRHNYVLDNPPFNMVLHTSPLKTPKLPYYHWYIEIIPKLTKHAGFEQGTGFYINPTPPEDAAKFLREVSFP
jgi:UDPglucose--hexose-1-phosphate uridylyltransferase